MQRLTAPTEEVTLQEDDLPGREPAGGISRRAFLAQCSAAALTVGIAPSALAGIARAAPESAASRHARHCRFTKAVLQDYGPFRGHNELHFAPRQNRIVGHNGSGRTTIARALERLGPAPETPEHRGVPDPRMAVRVEVDGNTELLARHRDLVFLSDCEDRRPFAARDVLTQRQLGMLDDAALGIFVALVPWAPNRLRGRGLAESLEQRCWGAGDVFFANLAYRFATRQLLALDLPLVLDCPYGALDDQHRVRLSAFLHGLPSQVILFSHDWYFYAADNEQPTCRLERQSGHTRITDLKRLPGTSRFT